MNEKLLSTLVNGLDDSLPRAAKDKITQSITSVSRTLNDAKMNSTKTTLLGYGTKNDKVKGTKQTDSYFS